MHFKSWSWIDTGTIRRYDIYILWSLFDFFFEHCRNIHDLCLKQAYLFELFHKNPIHKKRITCNNNKEITEIIFIWKTTACLKVLVMCIKFRWDILLFLELAPDKNNLAIVCGTPGYLVPKRTMFIFSYNPYFSFLHSQNIGLKCSFDKIFQNCYYHIFWYIENAISAM